MALFGLPGNQNQPQATGAVSSRPKGLSGLLNEAKAQLASLSQKEKEIKSAVKNTAKTVVSGAKQFATGLLNADVGKAFGKESLNKTNAGVVANTILGTPKAAKDVLFPTRGFEEKDLAQAKPTVTQKLEAPGKIVAETATALGQFPSYIPGYDKQVQKFTKTPLGTKLADAGQFISDVGKANNVEEAKAMRLVDAASLLPTPAAVGRTSRVVSAADEAGDAASAVNKLIAQGQIRVVRRGDRDVYQVMKGGQWANTRDESSAIAQATKQTPKLPTPQPRVEAPAPVLKKPEHLKFSYEGVPLAYTKEEKAILAKVRGDKEPPLPPSAGQILNRTQSPDGLRSPSSPQGLLSAKTSRVPEPLKATEAEIRTLEKSARQAQAAPDLPVPPGSKSLEDIVKQTPVQNKVNLLDYVRTPDRVLKKVGLGDEARVLRKQHETYLKELPQNIEKVTEWSKRAPGKEANERIFRYLDGDAIDLVGEERAVALEIKNWLQQWADRLKLPPTRRISDYITHIFEDQLIKKEFDEDLAKIISEKIPGEVYNPFLQQRHGIQGYKRDTWAALDAYTKRATRKVHMDPALERIEVAARDFEESQWKYVKRFVDRVNMRPTEFENLTDTLIKSIPKIGYALGQRPSLVLTRGMRRMAYRAMLGFNPGSAIRNLSQGANVYAKLGEKHTIMGYTKLFSPEARKELIEQGVLGDQFIQDRSLNATKKAIENMDKGLFVFFDAAEKINRGAAYLGAKSKYLSKNTRWVNGQQVFKPGTSMEDAIEYAKKVVRDTQFNYGTLDTPQLLQSDFVKTGLQFATYPLKQSEFLIEMARNKEFAGIVRYAFAGLTFVYTIGQAIGMKPEELIPSFRFGVPASLKFPWEVARATMDAPDKYGNKRDLGEKLGDVGDALLTGVVPAGTQIKKSFEGTKGVLEGGSFAKDGKFQYEVGGSPLKNAQAILFGKYSSPEAKEFKNKADSPEEKRIQGLYDQAQQLVAEGREEEAQSLVDNLTDTEYETYKEVRKEARKEKTLDGQKAMLQTVKEVQQLAQEGRTEEAQKVVDSLTDEEYEWYQGAKELLKTNPEDKSEGSFIDNVVTYAKAMGTDPVTAFNRIFTGQRIRRIDNGTIIVERMSYDASQKEREARGGNTPEYRLDHTVPLQLGGSNSKDNLQLVTTEEHSAWTPVENHLGKLLRQKRITKKEAQRLVTGLKDGSITKDEIMSLK